MYKQIIAVEIIKKFFKYFQTPYKHQLQRHFVLLNLIFKDFYLRDEGGMKQEEEIEQEREE